eukprot:3188457-Rhodomonas_salina.1
MTFSLCTESGREKKGNTARARYNLHRGGARRPLIRLRGIAVINRSNAAINGSNAAINRRAAYRRGWREA